MMQKAFPISSHMLCLKENYVHVSSLPRNKEFGTATNCFKESTTQHFIQLFGVIGLAASLTQYSYRHLKGVPSHKYGAFVMGFVLFTFP